jgi:hypothetical protein
MNASTKKEDSYQPNTIVDVEMNQQFTSAGGFAFQKIDPKSNSQKSNAG